jgi:hypothetical protein
VNVAMLAALLSLLTLIFAFQVALARNRVAQIAARSATPLRR